MISIARDYSRLPGNRYESEMPFSGEVFRQRYLVPALRSAKEHGLAVAVDLEGTNGYASGFLDEVFGGLVRVCGYSYQELKGLLFLVSDDPYDISDAWNYIKEADDDKRGQTGIR